jgi:succinate dehydrogenase/fumarate reductase flavoprotein subunit
MASGWEVIVVGAGGAGLAAAVSAAELGARVIVFESERAVGGSMALSGGVFYAAGTSVQARLGIEDSPERFYQHYMDLNEWELRTGLIRAFCENAPLTFEWLVGLGLDVPARLSANGKQPGLRRFDGDEVRRGHVPIGEGYALAGLLEKACRDLRVDIVLDTRIQHLIVEDGIVRGVIADGIEARADAVIIATGGMAQNIELLRRFFPDVDLAGDNLFADSGAGSRGDHISLGAEAGSAIAGSGWGTMLCGAYFQGFHHWQSGFPPVSSLLVDRSGRRFVNEDASYSPMFNMLKKAGGRAWLIFDEAGRNSLDPAYASWTPQKILAEVAAGRSFSGEDPAELASRIGVPPAALAASIERWNATLPAGTDPEFGRSDSLAAHGHPAPDAMVKPPYYAVRYQPVQLVQTHAGLEIDERARVISKVGQVIHGLFAAGESGGGVLGKHYVGATSLSNALTMGRIAGQSAARDPVADVG